MIPFQMSFRPRTPLRDQLVYAAKKAVASGQMRPGDPFPSVRFLSVSFTPMSLRAIFTAIARSAGGTA